MPPQRHAATYRGSDRGRPAGRCTVRAHASYSCCRRPRLRARRGNRQTAQGLALARTQNHTHASMHACARARGRRGPVRPGGRVPPADPSPAGCGSKGDDDARTSRNPHSLGIDRDKRKKNNPRTVMGARESVRVRGGRSARTLDRARNGRPEAAKPAAENVRAGKEAWAPMLLGPPLASPARDRSRSYRAAAAFSHGRCRPAGGPSLVPSQAAAGLVGRFARQKASTVDGLARRGGLAFLAVDSWLAAPPDWRRAHRGGEVGGDRPDPRPGRGGPPAPRLSALGSETKPADEDETSQPASPRVAAAGRSLPAAHRQEGRGGPGPERATSRLAPSPLATTLTATFMALL
jgi:hypothetical protein